MGKLKRKVKFKGSIITNLVGIFMIFLSIAFFIKMIPVSIEKNKIDNFANDLTRTIELRGSSSSIYSDIEYLKNKYSISKEIFVSVNPRRKLQLGEEFDLKVITEVDIGFWEFGSFPIAISAKGGGRSEVYHK